MATSDPFTNRSTTDRVAAVFGICAVIVSLGGIVSAILLSTRFSFATDALSDLGRATWNSSAVFNGALLVSGLCALVSGVVLARNSRTLLHTAGSVTFSLSAVCLALIGVFALPAPQHGPSRSGSSSCSPSRSCATARATCARVRAAGGYSPSRSPRSTSAAGRSGSPPARRAVSRSPSSSGPAVSRRGSSGPPSECGLGDAASQSTRSDERSWRFASST